MIPILEMVNREVVSRGKGGGVSKGSRWVYMWGAPPTGTQSTMDENKSTKTKICWGRKGGQSLKGERPGAFSSMGFYWVQFTQEYR